MPARNVSLTDELDRFVAEKVAAGLYANASEVMRTALRNLQEDEREYEAKLAALRVLIDEGDACDPADDINGEECMKQLHQRIVDRAAAQKEGRVS
jgi:antitoxin ParD1/3/4